MCATMEQLRGKEQRRAYDGSWAVLADLEEVGAYVILKL